MKRYLYLLSILAAVSCTAMPENPGYDSEGNQFVTKITEGDFINGDRIGLYVFEAYDTPYGGYMLADNYLIRVTDGGPVLSGELMFPDGPVDMFAYYPYFDENIITDNFLSVYTFEDQRPTRQYRESEHKFVKYLNYENTGKPVELAFERLVSRLSFELIPGEGFSSADELKDCEIIIPNIKYNSGIFIETGELKTPEGNRDFFPNTDELSVADGKVSGIHAMIVPQTLYEGASIANIRVGDDVFRCMLNEDFTLIKGVDYTVTVTLNKYETKSGDTECLISEFRINGAAWE